VKYGTVYGYKKCMARFLDLGSEIQDPRSGIEKNPDPGPRINIPDPQHC
jgi:hypothetical protein